MKRFVIVLLLICTCFQCFSLGTGGHSTDLAYIFYGYESISDLHKRAPSDMALSLDIMASAVAFAIDEQGMGKTADSYRLFLDNLAQTQQGKKYTFPAYSEFPSIGGGRHRAYNHQGFYWDYRDKYVDAEGAYVPIKVVADASAPDSGIQTDSWTNRYLDRWIMGRDRILKPAVAAAFNLGENDYRIEPIAIMFYYAHMIGDLYEGASSSINQMGDITTNYFLIMQLKSDLYDSLRDTGTEVYMYVENCIQNEVYLHVARAVRSCRSRQTAYIISRNFMKEHFTVLLRMMLGKDINDISVK